MGSEDLFRWMNERLFRRTPPHHARNSQPDARRVRDAFHRLYYGTGREPGPWRHTYWLGVPVFKCPLDLWVYQELIVELRPDWIIETGTAYGGSALYLASICDLLGHGRILTVDVVQGVSRPNHPRIFYVTGSSTSAQVLDTVTRSVRGASVVMVILDSDHSRDHVLNELRQYSNLVTLGSYLIVEDTNVNGHPVCPEHGPGPMEAVVSFVEEDKRFEVDVSREKFLMTFNPRGFLKKVAP